MDYIKHLKLSLESGNPDENLAKHYFAVLNRVKKAKTILPSANDMNGYDQLNSYNDIERIRTDSSSDKQIGFGKQSLKNYGKETCIVCERFLYEANRDFEERTAYLNEMVDYLGEDINNESTVIIVGPPTWS